MATPRQAVTSLLLTALPSLGRARAFPNQPVALLIACSPGGPADVLAHTAAEIMADRMAQPVVVYSEPGAGGQIAGKAALQAPAEAGCPAVAMSIWFGIVARSGTPAPCAQFFHDEVEHAIRQPAAARRLAELGFLPLTMPSAGFAKFMRMDSDRWGGFIKNSGIAVE